MLRDGYITEDEEKEIYRTGEVKIGNKKISFREEINILYSICDENGAPYYYYDFESNELKHGNKKCVEVQFEGVTNEEGILDYEFNEEYLNNLSFEELRDSCLKLLEMDESETGSLNSKDELFRIMKNMLELDLDPEEVTDINSLLLFLYNENEEAKLSLKSIFPVPEPDPNSITYFGEFTLKNTGEEKKVKAGYSAIFELNNNIEYTVEGRTFDYRFGEVTFEVEDKYVIIADNKYNEIVYKFFVCDVETGNKIEITSENNPRVVYNGVTYRINEDEDDSDVINLYKSNAHIDNKKATILVEIDGKTISWTGLVYAGVYD